MKLLQALLEEKATNQQILKIIGRFLVDQNKKLDQTNEHLANLIKTLQGTPVIEKHIVMENVGISGSTPEVKLGIKSSPDFIPEPDEKHLSMTTKKTTGKKKTVKKDFAKQAKKLKEDV